MSRDEFDGVNETPKKKMTVDQYFQQFQNLDNSNYGNWPLPVKITVWLFVFIGICAAGYFVLIKPLQDDIASAETQQQNLLQEFQKKDSDVRNATLLQQQLEQMEASFQQQLKQLPKETEIPSLVEDINKTGVTSGLKFKNIRLENEINQEFFIEQPISIEATGDYHHFGHFVAGISFLPRIVTLHDFEISSKLDFKKGLVPEVSYTLMAKTYRYKGEADIAAEQAAKEKAGDKK